MQTWGCSYLPMQLLRLRASNEACCMLWAPYKISPHHSSSPQINANWGNSWETPERETCPYSPGRVFLCYLFVISITSVNKQSKSLICIQLIDLMSLNILFPSWLQKLTVCKVTFLMQVCMKVIAACWCTHTVGCSLEVLKDVFPSVMQPFTYASGPVWTLVCPPFCTCIKSQPFHFSFMQP